MNNLKFCGLGILLLLSIVKASTTDDFNSIDERYGTYLLGSGGNYGSNTVSGSIVGVEVDGTDKYEYRSAITWNISSIADWAFALNGWFQCDTDAGPANSFTMWVREMESSPGSYGTNVQGFMDDVGSDDVF